MLKRGFLSLILSLAIVVSMTTGLALNVQAADDGKQITVSFRLIGDTEHSGSNHSKYITWIATKRYTVTEGSTASDVLKLALADNGMQQRGLENGYITAVSAPSKLGGYWLEAMENHPNAGWMFTLNDPGRSTLDDYHPYDGVATVLSHNDRIVFHYVDDYATEISWDGSPVPNNKRWLEAEDRVIAKNDDKDDDDTTTSTTVGGGSGGGISVPVRTETNTSASSNTDKEKVNQAIKNAEKDTVKLKDISYVSADALKSMAKSGLTLHADTTKKNSVETRLYIDPSQYKGNNDIKLGAAVGDEKVEKLFAKYYSNNIKTIKLEQKTSFGIQIKAAVKINLNGLDNNSLMLYSYDSESNKVKLIKNPDYRIDKNGFLHFTTDLAGTIILTDKALVKK